MKNLKRRLWGNKLFKKECNKVRIIEEVSIKVVSKMFVNKKY